MIDHQSRGLPEFEKLFAKLSQKQQSRRALDSEETREQDEWTEQQDQEQRQRTDDWQAHLREYESELRSNTFSPQNLHTLALVYSGDVLSHHTGLPRTTSPTSLAATGAWLMPLCHHCEMQSSAMTSRPWMKPSRYAYNLRCHG